MDLGRGWWLNVRECDVCRTNSTCTDYFGWSGAALPSSLQRHDSDSKKHTSDVIAER